MGEASTSRHDLSAAFGAAVREHADAEAVIGAHGVWTYAELDAACNRVGADLAGRGVTPGARVALVLDRSPTYVACILACMKLGACYVPIDPRTPEARLAELIGRVAPAAIIASDRVALSAPANWPVVPRGAMEDVIRVGGLATLPDAEIDPEAPAYIMFTSGSTGAPKGVVVPRRAIARLVLDPDFTTLGAGSRWLHASAPAFDASTLELWGPLANGGTCIVAEDRLPSLETLAGLIARHGITDAWLTATLFNAMVDYHAEALRGLTRVFTGGEAMSVEHARRFFERVPSVKLINGYGPTENTTFTCCHDVRPADLDGDSGVPIGSPIRGTEVVVLDDAGRPAADNAVGELVAGGEGVALGYLDDESQTRERFIALPGRSGRWYRTGDLVRRRRDGVIEYLGRVDRQVKIRGFRIEPEETELVMLRHPSVTAAAVLVVGDSAEQRRLVGFYEPTGPIEPADLSAWLAARLPAHQCPSSLHRLDAMPRSASGKVDRGALAAMPAVTARQPDSASGDRGDWSPEETAVCRIVGELLPGADPTPDRDFFELGGHSLTALRLVCELSRRLGVRIEPSEVFARPRLGDLAARVRTAPASSTDVARQAAGKPTGPDDPRPRAFPTSRMQRQLVFEAEADETRSAYHVLTAFETGPGFSPGAFRAAWERAIERHEALRTAISPEVNEIVQRVQPADRVKHATWIDGAACTADDAGRLPEPVLDGVFTAFDVEAGVVARVHCHACEGEPGVVIIAIHHAFVDDWSLRQLLSELAEDYLAIRDGETPSERGDEQPFSLFAEADAMTDVRDRASRVAGYLLADHDDAKAATSRPGGIDFVQRSLDPSLAAAVERIARDLRVTPFSVWLACFALAIGARRGRASAWVLIPVSCRVRPSFERAWGCCISTQPVRIDWKAGMPFSEVVERAAGAVRAAYQHPMLSLEDIHGAIRKLGGDARSCSPRTAFALRDRPPAMPDIGGDAVRPLTVPPRGAKFEAGLTVELHAEGPRCIAECDRAATEMKSATGLLYTFAQILQEATARPAEPVGVLMGETVGSATAGGGPGDEAADLQAVDRSARDTATKAWARILGHSPGSDDEDFFDAGGHSLLALRLMAEVKRMTGRDLALPRFLERPTFAGLARLIERDSRDQRGAASIAMTMGEGPPPRVLAIPGAAGGVLSLRGLFEAVTAAVGRPIGLECIDLAPAVRATKSGTFDELCDLLAEEYPTPGSLRGVLGYSVGGLVALRLAEHWQERTGRHVDVWCVDTFATEALVGLTAKDRTKQDLQLIMRSPIREGGRVLARRSGSLVRRVKKMFGRQHSPATADLSQAEVARLIGTLPTPGAIQFDGGATLFQSTDQPSWRRAASSDDTNGLSTMVNGPIEVVKLRGVHAEMLTRNGPAIARHLAKAYRDEDR